MCFREHKPLWQLNKLDDFAISTIANLFLHERPKIPEAYSESSPASKDGVFCKFSLQLKVINYLNPINFWAPLIFTEHECAKINSARNRPFFAHLSA